MQHHGLHLMQQLPHRGDGLGTGSMPQRPRTARCSTRSITVAKPSMQPRSWLKNCGSPSTRVDRSPTRADIHMHPNGRFVFGSNRGHDSIAVFAVGSDGRLDPVGHVSTRSSNGMTGSREDERELIQSIELRSVAGG